METDVQFSQIRLETVGLPFIKHLPHVQKFFLLGIRLKTYSFLVQIIEDIT